MASIIKRKDCNKYRVQLRKKDTPSYSKNFNSYKEAHNWICKHEEEFYRNPTPYLVMKNTQREPTVHELNPHSHPKFQEMQAHFQKVVKKYFSKEDFESGDLAKATQEIYELSLKYKTME